jgi:tripeptide aminopeptidase
VRAVGRITDEVARPQLDHVVCGPRAHPAGCDEHTLDDSRPVRESVVVAVERELENLGQPAAVQSVEQAQVERPADDVDTLVRAHQFDLRLLRLLEQVAEGDAEPEGERPERLDRRISAPLLEVRERRLRHARARGELGQRQPPLRPQAAEVRPDYVDDGVHTNKTARIVSYVGTNVERDAGAIARIPAPAGQEEGRRVWLERRLSDRPGELRRDEVGNLIWSLGAAPYRLALLAHLDTVFGEDVPHEVVERDGRLVGPGIGDNALAVALAVNVVEELWPELDAPLAVVFTVGEEGLGGLRGARHAVATLSMEQAIALEGHGLDHVVADAVGCVRVRLTVTGPGGHSWQDRDRPSAIDGLVSLLAPLGGVNVGLVSGGDAVNAIASCAEAVVETRSRDEAELEEAAARFAALEAPDGLVLRVETVDRRPGGRLDRGHPLLAAVRAVRAELDLPDRLEDGSTDANAAFAAGTPALCLGCALGGGMHTRYEWIERDSIPSGIAQLEGVLRRLLA